MKKVTIISGLLVAGVLFSGCSGVRFYEDNKDIVPIQKKEVKENNFLSKISECPDYKEFSMTNINTRNMPYTRGNLLVNDNDIKIGYDKVIFTCIDRSGKEPIINIKEKETVYDIGFAFPEKEKKGE